MRLGIDVGSTTVKLVLLDENDKVTYSRYERHMSNVFKTVVDMLREMYETVGDIKLRTVITGSGGLSLSKRNAGRAAFGSGSLHRDTAPPISALCAGRHELCGNRRPVRLLQGVYL